MNAALLFSVIAVGWVVVTAGFTLPNLALGAVIALLVLALFRHQLQRVPRLSRPLAVLRLALLFAGELLQGALTVARLALTPNLRRRLKPAVVAFPLAATSDAEITLLASLITLTPGTLAVDVAADRRRLFVHVLLLRSRESLVADIGHGLEARVMDVFR